ncbi:MAG: CHAD domain-containing protein [Bacteroidia bacterium]|nr:CHAD domain-containing protein [Bacteroidia bacterium]MCX7764417.1 CHAD domain-containing protein [Bacteroidia bacterium]MDW8056704.1 CHAD domain-containing protein [Bacteroidia bacterium]
MKNEVKPSAEPSKSSVEKKRNPFKVGLRRLRKATPKAVYRFRRRIKRLRVYLALYSFPQPAPHSKAIDKLFRRAGKLRQAYLYLEWVKLHAPEWKDAAKAEISYRKRRFKKAYKKLVKEVKSTLAEWEKRFPPPWIKEESLPLWENQGRLWVEAQKEALRKIDSESLTPEKLHELRTILRQWELAAAWVELPEKPPANLTTYLGEARDLYLLQRWLQKLGAEESLLQHIHTLRADLESQALAVWRKWFSS